MGRQVVKNDELISALNARYALACASNANNRFNLKKALDSLRKHRGKIFTAVDLGRVKDLNSRMAKLLEKVLNGTEPRIPPGAEEVLNRGPPIPLGFPYVPQVGSGARAILIAMYRESRKMTYNGFMTKDEICARATDTGLSETSFYPRRMEIHCAWDGVKTLESHELVKRQKIGTMVQQRFLITDEGKALAHYLDVTLGNNNDNARVDDNSYFDEDDNIPSFERGIFGLGPQQGGGAEQVPRSFEPIRGADIVGSGGRLLGEGSTERVEFPESVMQTGRDLFRAGKLVNVAQDEGGSQGGVQVFRAKCRSATLQRKMYDVSIVARTEGHLSAETGPCMSAESAHKVAELVAMGFADNMARAALRATANDLEAAGVALVENRIIIPLAVNQREQVRILQSQCSCPSGKSFGGKCKHAAALMTHVVESKGHGAGMAERQGSEMGTASAAPAAGRAAAALRTPPSTKRKRTVTGTIADLARTPGGGPGPSCPTTPGGAKRAQSMTPKQAAAEAAMRRMDDAVIQRKRLEAEDALRLERLGHGLRTGTPGKSPGGEGWNDDDFLSVSEVCHEERRWEGGNSSRTGVGTEVCVVIDDKERVQNSNWNTLYSELDRQHQGAREMMLGGATVGTECRCLAVGDYVWVAQERERSLMLDLGVERKTIDDLVRRSNVGAHLRQLQIMRASGLRHVFFLLEGDFNRATAAASREERERERQMNSPETIWQMIADLIFGRAAEANVPPSMLDLNVNSVAPAIHVLQTKDNKGTCHLLTHISVAVTSDWKNHLWHPSAPELPTAQHTLDKFHENSRKVKASLKAYNNNNTCNSIGGIGPFNSDPSPPPTIMKSWAPSSAFPRNFIDLSDDESDMLRSYERPPLGTAVVRASPALFAMLGRLGLGPGVQLERADFLSWGGEGPPAQFAFEMEPSYSARRDLASCHVLGMRGEDFLQQMVKLQGQVAEGSCVWPLPEEEIEMALMLFTTSLPIGAIAGGLEADAKHVRVLVLESLHHACRKLRNMAELQELGGPPAAATSHLQDDARRQTNSLLISRHLQDMMMMWIVRLMLTHKWHVQFVANEAEAELLFQCMARACTRP